MKDRIPTYPGRVTAIPVSGQAHTYDVSMADAPTEPGTPPTKANLLSDETAAFLGITQDNPTVSDALRCVVPRGCILLWSGSTSTIPGGWALCNGQNGTPDLRDRFVVGAGSTYAVAAKGGGAGRLFGSVTNQEIADALAKTGIKLDKRKITIAEPIKNVGTYTVTCKLGYEISAPLTVKIVEA